MYGAKAPFSPSQSFHFAIIFSLNSNVLFFIAFGLNFPTFYVHFMLKSLHFDHFLRAQRGLKRPLWRAKGSKNGRGPDLRPNPKRILLTNSAVNGSPGLPWCVFEAKY